jgi:methyl-accepting chemotaxis protein
VVALTQRFGGIVGRLDNTISSSQSKSSQHASAAATDAQQAETNLTEVIQALHAIQQSRAALAQEITAIVTYTGELQKMADEVKQIAFQTNMLSLNAAIEAAHAGESGKGFSVVAHEVQLLSKASRETGQNIYQRVTTINDALLKIAERNESVSGYDNAAIERSEKSITEVLQRQRARMEQLSREAESARNDSAAIRDDVENSLIEFQFQDRVSQILAQITQAMTEYGSAAGLAMDAPSGMHASNDHLASMARSYTTEEQRRIHSGLDAETVRPQAATFF